MLSMAGQSATHKVWK